MANRDAQFSPETRAVMAAIHFERSKIALAEGAVVLVKEARWNDEAEQWTYRVCEPRDPERGPALDSLGRPLGGWWVFEYQLAPEENMSLF